VAPFQPAFKEGRPVRSFKNHCFLATAVETTLSSAAIEERPLNMLVVSDFSPEKYMFIKMLLLLLFGTLFTHSFSQALLESKRKTFSMALKAFSRSAGHQFVLIKGYSSTNCSGSLVNIAAFDFGVSFPSCPYNSGQCLAAGAQPPEGSGFATCINQTDMVSILNGIPEHWGVSAVFSSNDCDPPKLASLFGQIANVCFQSAFSSSRFTCGGGNNSRSTFFGSQNCIDDPEFGSQTVPVTGKCTQEVAGSKRTFCS
jgi:hypothetical protein